MRKSQCVFGGVVFLLASVSWASGADLTLSQFTAKYCGDCHGKTTQEATLDLSLPPDFGDPDHFRRFVKVHDRLAANEMPPKEAEQPSQAERNAIVKELRASLIAAESAKETPMLRRLTRAEYENTNRDLFDMPGIALAGNLPADGQAHGFDKHADALDISHVNINKYLEAADHILNFAIATRPNAPKVQKRRISLANRGGFVAHVLGNGDGILLKNGQPDPDFPPAADQHHLDEGAHERWGSFRNGSSVGLFRHEDESFSPYFIEHVTIYPGRYRVRTSLWSFQWDKGKMLRGRGMESARLSVVQLTGDGRGGQHPSYVLGYFDAPDSGPLEHELVVWLNHNEILGFNTASLVPVANYSRPGRAMAFTGPGIVVDWLDIEGPLHDAWPPKSHKRLFGELPMVEFKPAEHPQTTPPRRLEIRQLGAGQNRPDPSPGLWTVESGSPLEDADRLLTDFLPRLFRRPVPEEVRRQYLDLFRQRLEAGDTFEFAMRAAYRNALVAPDFLYHLQPNGELDDYALACRLSYFLWNSLPDETLRQHAEQGDLRKPEVLHAEVERLLSDPRSERFIEDFLGQWLKLRQIAANDPDKKLYPEYSPYLQDAMLAETRKYFRELIEKNLDTSHLIQSDFVMVNQKLAAHYDIPDVTGSAIRRVPFPEGCPRGGFLTQAAILKLTANGTTTSPVPRGAFVMDRLLGEPPEPPPANVAAIEPDVRGATTIREKLAKHREHEVCASCHSRIDPPGFALESFDVIGGFRERYRTIGEGDAVNRGKFDPFIPIGFKLGPRVDSSGRLTDGRAFTGIREYQDLLAKDSQKLLKNLTEQLSVYSTGRAIRFSDRPLIEELVRRTDAQGGGVRTLIHELVASPLFTGGETTIDSPSNQTFQPFAKTGEHRMLMAQVLADVNSHALPAVTEDAKKQEFLFDDSSSIELQVTGLFIPERAEDFRILIQKFPEAKLLQLDGERAKARFAYAKDSDLFRGADLEQVRERLNNRVRELSDHTIGLKAPATIVEEKFEHAEIPIVGLDCKACSLAVYEILMRVDGVERATASFHDGRAKAWYDPEKTNRAKLEAALKERGVQLKSP